MMFNCKKTLRGPWRCVSFWWQNIYKYRLPRNILQLAQELHPALQRQKRRGALLVIVQVKWLKAVHTQPDNYKDIVLNIVLNIKE